MNLSGVEAARRIRAQDSEARTRVAGHGDAVTVGRPRRASQSKSQRHQKEFDLMKYTWRRETVIDSPLLLASSACA